MERRLCRPNQYRIIWLDDGRVFDFTSAQAAVDHLFVHGNFAMHRYPIYKNNKRFRPKKAGLMSTDALVAALRRFR